MRHPCRPPPGHKDESRFARLGNPLRFNSSTTRSKSPDPRKRLLDIRDNIQLARAFVEGVDYGTFRDNQLLFYAVTRALEIISEASRRLPEDMKARHPDIPWVEMAGAGNVYRHDYEEIRQRLVWGTVHNRLPALSAAVEQELATLGELP
jgi:uncharacterized protein with HEPN domain